MFPFVAAVLQVKDAKWFGPTNFLHKFTIFHSSSRVVIKWFYKNAFLLTVKCTATCYTLIPPSTAIFAPMMNLFFSSTTYATSLATSPTSPIGISEVSRTLSMLQKKEKHPQI